MLGNVTQGFMPGRQALYQRGYSTRKFGVCIPWLLVCKLTVLGILQKNFIFNPIKGPAEYIWLTLAFTQHALNRSNPVSALYSGERTTFPRLPFSRATPEGLEIPPGAKALSVEDSNWSVFTWDLICPGPCLENSALGFRPS